MIYDNITLVAINSKYIHQSLAIYYLKSYSRRDDINLIETNINVDTDKIIDKIVKTNPQLVGFSCYIFNIEKTLEVAKKLRDKCNCRIFFGGPEASYENDYLFEYCDQIIEGPGEIAFYDLINGDTSKRIVGIPVNNPLEFSPYTKEYFENSKGKISYFEASRGCPFRCNYCMSSKDKLQLFDIEIVKKELLKFKGSDVKILKFVDRTFNAKTEYTNQILQFLIDNFSDEDIIFHFEIAPDIVQDSTLKIISKARPHLFQFEAGIQTFNDDVLRNTNRKSNIEKAVKNIKTLLSFKNCHIHSDLIIGLVSEDMTSLRNSFNCLYNIWTNQMQVGILKVLKGSPLKEQSSDGYIFSSIPPYEIISTPTMTKDEVDLGKKLAYLIDKYYNTNRFYTTLRYLANKYEPYIMFVDLAKAVDYSDGVFVLYEQLYNLVISYGEDKELINELLKFDYFRSNNSKNLPPIIKREFNKEFKKITNKFKKNNEFAYYFSINPITIKKGEFVIYFDYLSKDYITELYNYRILDYASLKNQLQK